PFPNQSQFRLYDWFYNSSHTKSKEDFNDLLDVLRSQGFSLDHLGGGGGFSAQQAQDTVDDFAGLNGVFSMDNGWHQGSLKILLPKTRAKYPSEDQAPTATIQGLFYRRLLEVLLGVATDQHFTHAYHWIPHILSWQPPLQDEHGAGNGLPHSQSSLPHPDPVRVFTDTFNTNTMLCEHAKIQVKP
ncbi:hypothetical protein BC628DRAFT_1465324, partial [Trametes gibbosa]